MVNLRSCQLTLLTSLTFGAVLGVGSAPLIAQTTQDLPKAISNLNGYDVDTRQTIELLALPRRETAPLPTAHV